MMDEAEELPAHEIARQLIEALMNSPNGAALQMGIGTPPGNNQERLVVVRVGGSKNFGLPPEAAAQLADGMERSMNAGDFADAPRAWFDAVTTLILGLREGDRRIGAGDGEHPSPPTPSASAGPTGGHKPRAETPGNRGRAPGVRRGDT